MKTIKLTILSILFGLFTILFVFSISILGQDGTDTPFAVNWPSLGIGAAGGITLGGIIGSAIGKHTKTGHVTLLKRGPDTSSERGNPIGGLTIKAGITEDSSSSIESLKEKPKEKPPAKDKDLKGHVTLIK